MDGSVTYQLFDALTRMFSPYQFNPSNFNPLRQLLEASVDFDRLEKCRTIKLFLSATNVRTGKVRVFRTEEITADVVMASACLPMLFQAVKIENDHYWDGGYMGNPALFPLFYHTQTRDLLVIHINPIEREELPTSAADIMNRLNEITFNSSLLKEMRAIAFVTKLIEEDWLKKQHKRELKHLIMHAIRAEDVLSDLSVASKFNTDWNFLLYLRDLGRDEAGKWLKQNFASIGKQSTIDLRAEFLDLGTHHAG
jgi:NTE family protein